MSNHGIINYPDAQAVQKQLDDLIKKPIYSIAPDALKKYEEEYFDNTDFKELDRRDTGQHTETHTSTQTY